VRLKDGRNTGAGWARWGVPARIVFSLLLTCLCLTEAVAEPRGGPGSPDHEPGKGPPIPKQQPQRPADEGGPGEHQEGCHVSPQRLSDFANGESYDYGSLVAYLASPGCQANSRQIATAAIANGVAFSNKLPYRLDYFAEAFKKNDLESGKRTEMALAQSLPGLLRQNPLGTSEMLPLIGQLALLSPEASRTALVSVIQQELYAGDLRLSSSDVRGKDAVAADLAKTLVKLGAGEAAIAYEMAEGVEDMALLVQADSLVRFFRGLSAAAAMDSALVPTFNLSAGAFARGIIRGKEQMTKADRGDLTRAAFEAIRSTLAAGGSLEPGAGELNEALSGLMGERPLNRTALRRVWKDAVRVLAGSSSQPALADAVALSLTPQVVFLTPEDLEQVLLACRNYPQVAGALQANYLLAWRRMWADLHDARIKIKAFNRMKTRYFEPLVAEILELDPYMIDVHWLREMISRGLVQDEHIEKRFPRFVLAYLERRERASRVAAAEPGPEPVLGAMAENFAVVWTLSTTHVPALMKWVKKYEQ